MSQFNEQTFLQLLRSNVLSTDEYVRKELNVIADILEEYGVDSPSELKNKFSSPKKKSTSRTTKPKHDLFVDDCNLCITNRDAGNNVDVQIEKLVQTFQTFDSKNVQKIASRFELPLTSKKDSSKFKTWLQTGQKPLTSEEEKELLRQSAQKIYEESNRCFTEANVVELVKITTEFKNKYPFKELKGFIQSFEPDLTASKAKDLIQKYEARLKGEDSKERRQSKSRTSSTKQVKLFDPEKDSYKDEINGLINDLNANPTDENRLETVQKIENVVENVKNDYTLPALRSFVQNVFDSRIKGKKKDDLFNKTVEYIEDSFLSVSNASSHKDLVQETFPTLKVYNPSQNDAASNSIESYARQAIQLRDEKSYELTVENISMIIKLAEDVKRIYKLEGLKSFMDALDINWVGVKSGMLLDRIKCHLEDVAIMRYKAVSIQEMK